MIIGIGYEGITIDDLVADLRSRRIELVVDVRLNAISRKPGFSRRALSAALDAAGIAYRHEPVLGNPRENRDPFRAGEPAAVDLMRNRMSSVGAEAMARLTAEVRRSRVAVLCFEFDERQCHRRLIIDASTHRNDVSRE